MVSQEWKQVITIFVALMLIGVLGYYTFETLKTQKMIKEGYIYDYCLQQYQMRCGLDQNGQDRSWLNNINLSNISMPRPSS